MSQTTVEVPFSKYPNWWRWREWCKNFSSPWSYVDFGWLFCVSSALQRRVWLGKLEGQPLFANNYTVFIGTSGVGKGMVTREVKKLLAHHKYRAGDASNVSKVDALEEIIHPKLLFSMGPHDTTYEQFCVHMAENTRSVKYEKDGKKHVYSHASMSLVLEELGTLFKRRENSGLSKFLLQIYDCTDYDYTTKTRGTAIIRAPWLSLLGGCTPSFLPDGIRLGILEDGTVSRMLFIFETTPRPTPFFLVQPDDSAIAGRKILLEHLHNLSKVFGEVTFAAAAMDYLEQWNRQVLTSKSSRFSAKMESYFSRVKIHIMKYAMAVHFSERLTMEVSLADVKMAIALLESIETKMDIGFSAVGRNQFAGVSKDILSFIKSQQDEFVSLPDLLQHFSNDLSYEELDRQLKELVIMDRLIERDSKYSVKLNGK